MVEGAIRNGGIYIKLGQGLCSFNHLLPPEYIRTLQILEDKALNRRYKEVRTVAQTGEQCSAAEDSLQLQQDRMFVPATGGRSLPRRLPQNPGAAV